MTRGTHPKFIVLALPRSRTAWLSALLSYPPFKCGHDIAAESSSITDFKERFAALHGTCETGAVVGWPLLRQHYPNATIIVIKRPVQDIERSLAKFDVTPVPGELEARRTMLDACAEDPGVVSFNFEDLNDPFVCSWIFQACLGIPFDWEWYDRLAPQNIQVDVQAQIERLRAGNARLTGFKREVMQAVYGAQVH